MNDCLSQGYSLLLDISPLDRAGKNPTFPFELNRIISESFFYCNKKRKVLTSLNIVEKLTLFSGLLIDFSFVCKKVTK